MSDQSRKDLIPGSFRNGPPDFEPVFADTSRVKNKIIDISYSDISESHKLDLYLPDEIDGTCPLIIEIHGGGFELGAKSEMVGPMLKGLSRGYAVASIDYRLSFEAKFPAAVEDVKAAIRFLRAHSDEYKVDPERFAVWGGSAGGYLSVMIAATCKSTLFSRAELGNAGISESVKAAVDWFGPMMFSTMDSEFSGLGLKGVMGLTCSPDSPESRFIGAEVGSPEARELVLKASPLSYLSSETVPVFIQHGDRDQNIPITQSENLYKKLAGLIGDDNAFFEVLKGAEHGGPEFDSDENADKVLNFLDKYLR